MGLSGKNRDVPVVRGRRRSARVRSRRTCRTTKSQPRHRGPQRTRQLNPQRRRSTSGGPAPRPAGSTSGDRRRAKREIEQTWGTGPPGRSPSGSPTILRARRRGSRVRKVRSLSPRSSTTVSAAKRSFSTTAGSRRSQGNIDHLAVGPVACGSSTPSGTGQGRATRRRQALPLRRSPVCGGSRSEQDRRRTGLAARCRPCRARFRGRSRPLRAELRRRRVADPLRQAVPIGRRLGQLDEETRRTHRRRWPPGPGRHQPNRARPCGRAAVPSERSLAPGSNRLRALSGPSNILNEGRDRPPVVCRRSWRVLRDQWRVCQLPDARSPWKSLPVRPPRAANPLIGERSSVELARASRLR